MVGLSRFDLTDSVAVVTGGSGLLGREHCAALMELGAKVFIGDLDSSHSIAVAKSLNTDGYPGRAFALNLDVTSETSINTALTEIIAKADRLDILINNAAIDPKIVSDGIQNTSRLENFPLDEWVFQLSVGLTGSFLCSKVFGSLMASTHGGVILNVASDLSILAPDQRIYAKGGLERNEQMVKPVTYSVIKSGLVGLTRYLATYWNDVGVRVNSISPGGVYNNQDPDFVKMLVDRIPLGRMAKKDEYRAAVQFLCSDASSYMTGHNLIVDGGRSIW